jgi:hypothetical protein
MPKRSSKPRPEPDTNETAFRVAQEATGHKPKRKKNPAAVALGRLGGKKGGKARAEKLSPSRRSEIAQKAAQARWSNPTASDISGSSPLT